MATGVVHDREKERTSNNIKRLH